MKKGHWMGVGLAYVGTVIGAGFASGQEIWQFFSRHGAWGGAGIALAGLTFLILGRAALETGRRGVAHFSAFVSQVYGRYGVALEYVVTLVLALGVGVVAVGGGAALSDMTHWPKPLAGLLVLGSVLLTASFGNNTVVRVNSIVVPYLLMLTITLALWPHAYASAAHVDPRFWWLSALLYVSYNLFTGMMALLGLGSMLKSGQETWRAALLAAVLLTGVAFLEHRILLRIGDVGDLPMMTVASAVGGPMRLLFGVSLLAAMYTTGLGQAFALVNRYGRLRSQWLWLSGAMMGWPFQTLVSSLYPLLGVVSVAFWAPLLLPRRKN